MGKQLKQLEPARSPAHRLGAELRRWRVLVGLSQDGLGVATCHSGALVSKIERGERSAGLDFCRAADAELRTGGALERLWTASVAAPGTATGTDAALARLRRALGTLGVGSGAPRSRTLDEVERDVRAVTEDRLHARYANLAATVPGLVAELANAELGACDGAERQRVAALMVLALRAADGFAFKLGHHDLSARLIDLMTARAEVSEDPATVAAAAYVATETYFATGDLATAYRALVAAIDRAAASPATAVLAATGALHMRAAVVCGRLGDAAAAAEHLSVGGHVADRVPEGVYRGTAFGPDSLRIHELAVATELRDATAVDRVARWRPPAALPAERRSHYFIELGRAQFDLGRFGDARDALATARQIAPQHTRRHPQVVRISTALRQTSARRRDRATT